MGSVDLENKTVIIAEASGVKIEAPLTSGEPQGFWAANRNFDEQWFFMQLVKSRGEDDSAVESAASAALREARNNYNFIVGMTSNNDISRIGQLLYGESWVGSMSNVLSVDERSVRRWKAGTHAVPAGVWDELKILLEGRAADIYAALSELS